MECAACSAVLQSSSREPLHVSSVQQGQTWHPHRPSRSPGPLIPPCSCLLHCTFPPPSLATGSRRNHPVTPIQRIINDLVRNNPNTLRPHHRSETNPTASRDSTGRLPSRLESGEKVPPYFSLCLLGSTACLPVQDSSALQVSVSAARLWRSGRPAATVWRGRAEESAAGKLWL